MNARIPVAAHAMQSYYNFDVEGMQQRSSQVLSSALVIHLRPRECGHLWTFHPLYRARTLL